MDAMKEERTSDGNAAAMREALISVRSDLWDMMGTTSEALKDKIAMNICATIRAALAKPPRNCDVGTLTEQQQRFHNFCEKMQHTEKACCGGCPIVHLRMQGVINNSCELAWAQMPYKEGGAK